MGTKEIQDLYQTLVSSIQGGDDASEKVKKRKKTRKKDNDYEDDIDDFYDKTKHRKIDSIKSKSADNSESQESLSVKWNKLLEQGLKIDTEHQKCKQRIQILQTRIKSMNSQEDKFFVQNDLQLLQDSMN